MKIAVLSGKGGTGKTTVSNNLAALVPHATIIDCDVEEPNSHIFLTPVIDREENVTVGYPVIDEEKCTHCRACASFCNYHAIIASSKVTMPMKELCHDCGGCALVCKAGAISYEHRPIGRIYEGKASTGNPMIYGELTTGELSGVKIINRLRNLVEERELVIIDSPPGTSCSTVAAVEDTDFAVLVTEPTPFGVSDMKMVVEMLREMGIPMTVVINKAGLGDEEVYNYCREEKLTIAGEIPFDRTIAEAYADGKLAVYINKETKSLFSRLRDEVLSLAEAEYGRA